MGASTFLHFQLSAFTTFYPPIRLLDETFFIKYRPNIASAEVKSHLQHESPLGKLPKLCYTAKTYHGGSRSATQQEELLGKVRIFTTDYTLHRKDAEFLLPHLLPYDH